MDGDSHTHLIVVLPMLDWLICIRNICTVSFHLFVYFEEKDGAVKSIVFVQILPFD